MDMRCLAVVLKVLEVRLKQLRKRNVYSLQHDETRDASSLYSFCCILGAGQQHEAQHALQLKMRAPTPIMPLTAGGS